MAEKKRRPPTSVDNIVWNIFEIDLGRRPKRMELGFVKNVFYGDVNNYMRYDPRDVVPKEKIYEKVCDALVKQGYTHHIHKKREWFERPG